MSEDQPNVAGNGCVPAGSRYRTRGSTPFLAASGGDADVSGAGSSDCFDVATRKKREFVYQALHMGCWQCIGDCCSQHSTQSASESPEWVKTTGRHVPSANRHSGNPTRCQLDSANLRTKAFPFFIFRRSTAARLAIACVINQKHPSQLWCGEDFFQVLSSALSIEITNSILNISQLVMNFYHEYADVLFAISRNVTHIRYYTI